LKFYAGKGVEVMRVLFLGGTGTISTACVRDAIDQGFEVFILNRGKSHKRQAHSKAKLVIGDVFNDLDLISAVSENKIDVVCDFLCFDADRAHQVSKLLAGKISQYIFIATASSYQKPIHKLPITEKTLLDPQGLSIYSQKKIEAENVFSKAYTDEKFPVTIVRPSHTYDDANPPLIGDWTNWKRVLEGLPIFLWGDGTTLWTITHADDFAPGFTSLIGNTQSIGDAFHITSDFSYTWEEIYYQIGLATGVSPNLFSLTSEQIAAVFPDWFWAEQIIGDLSHCAIFDNSKIKSISPRFQPKVTWEQGVRRLDAWYESNKTTITFDEEINRNCDKLFSIHKGIIEYVNGQKSRS
jgi:nucleoside-diphosphate-sugar epimerase